MWLLLWSGGNVENYSDLICRAAVCLLTSVVSGILWVGLINVCVRSAAACVAAPSEDILGNGGGGGFLGRTLWCWRLAS